ncbi:MAG: epoxyqueuosine reductase QueH [Eubacteriales bacterium]|nr:epoxyqueuosine reductase QueH [Eubacteriales bacterium]
MNKRNYQKEMDSLLENLKTEGRTPTLLLHSCCAPCSSYPLQYLTEYFNIAVLYYNPNISTREEYLLRLSEQRRLIGEMPKANPIALIEGEYTPEEFYAVAKGLEDSAERGPRCHECYRLRLSRAAKTAREVGADYFATTLTLSPLKDANVINEIGESVAEQEGVEYLCSDFKKKEGYKKSIELSMEYNLYRQNFCGCIFSKRK